MNSRYDVVKQKVEEQMMGQLPTAVGPFAPLIESMRYSFEAGGKRIRPVLMQLAYEAVGGEDTIDAHLTAIEMIHTYSLIHDDLPAMDNDDLRRGKKTNHIVFGEATAILAGDALLNYAFELMLQKSIDKDDMACVRAAMVLGEASGLHGMIGGQILDMLSEGKRIDEETLDCIHLHKTGALLSAATKMGAILGHGSSKEIAALEMYGKYLGKVFQIIDDVLDEVGDTATLGKKVQSDLKNEKSTYTSFYTIDECYEIAQTLTDKAIKCLEHIDRDTSLLREIAEQLVHRKY